MDTKGEIARRMRSVSGEAQSVREGGKGAKVRGVKGANEKGQRSMLCTGAR